MELSADILSGLIRKEDIIVVGVSGGADSMCLLSLLEQKRKDINFSLVAVHVNHNIRDEEAKRDEKFVEEFCKTNNIDLKIIHVKALEYAKKFNKNIEQSARELRYDAFKKVMDSIKADKLFVAHHSDDQAETVLMHICRGSSIKGARGMNKQYGNIVRPLLSYSREDILNYNNKNNISYVEDSTNSDIHYIRNYIRKEILPRLETVYPKVKSSICSFASHCSNDDDFIESLLPLGLLKIDKTEDLARLNSEVVDLNFALSSRLIKRAFVGIKIYADIEEKHIKQVLELFNMKNGSKINLPCGVLAYKEYNCVVITRQKKRIEETELPFCLNEIDFKGFGKIFAINITGKQEPEFGDGNHYLDLEAIPINAVWRTKREGDIFKKLGAGSKKLSDYFTDKKIPLRIRNTIPVLAVGSTILAVAGLDISDGVKVTGKTEQIVKIIYVKND